MIILMIRRLYMRNERLMVWRGETAQVRFYPALTGYGKQQAVMD